MNEKLLSLQDIIEILSAEGIIFKAYVADLGEDTDFECIVFDFEDDGLYWFDYYLNIDTHGHTIEGGKHRWLYSPKNKEDFLRLIREGHY